MTLAQDALTDAILKTLADDVEAALKGSRAGLKRAMADLGIKSLSAKLPDGTEVATLTLAGGSESPRITDPQKFLAWVQEVHPTETEVIVRPGYAEALLKEMGKAGRPVDPRTGEIVPGVEFLPTTQYVTPSFTRKGAGGREQIRRAHRDGQIDLGAVLALPGGEAPGAA